MSIQIKLVGIVNLTPDSFSDGGKYIEKSAAIDLARGMIEQGADIVELGADSTRPGSKCAGIEEEWSRLRDILAAVTAFAAVGVDTHQPEVAKRALAEGALMINDVSAGANSAMFDVVANSKAQIVLMHSICSTPHNFDLVPDGDLIERICHFLNSRKQFAIASGIGPEKIILDPGFGAFLNSKADSSFELVKRFKELEVLGSNLMIACSRKGFLKQDGERHIEERDEISAQVATQIIRQLKTTQTIYIRAHNIEAHRGHLFPHA